MPPTAGDDGGRIDPLIAQLESGTLGAAVARRIMEAMTANAELAEAVAGMEAAGALSSLVERWRQRKGLDRLKAAVADPTSPAAALRAVIREESWVFGGWYATPYVRRRLPVLEQLGVPLIRSDGAIHAVEVERANLPDLVVREHGRYVVGPELHAAVNRVINQLRLLDDHAAEIRHELMVECRRAFGTVIAGHPAYLADQNAVADQSVREAIRTYNSHLAGVEVVTYQDLIEGSERVLMISDQSADETGQPRHALSAGS